MNVAALEAYFEESVDERSTLGGLDCARFAIESLYVGWGRDFRNALGYDDRKSAVRRLRRAGGLEAAFTAELGNPVDGANLEVGDLAFYEDPAIGIVMPGYVAVKYRQTILRVPLNVHRKGWKTWVRS